MGTGAILLALVFNAQTPEDYIRVLAQGRHQDRRAAADSLAQLGDDALPALVRIVAGKPARVQRRCAYVLARIGDPAVPPLERALHKSDWPECDLIATTLGWIGNGRAVVALVQASAHEDDSVTESAIEAITMIGEAAKDALPTLVSALDDEDYAVRAAATRAIQAVDPVGGAAVPAILLLAPGFSADGRKSAYDALARLRQAGVAALLELMRTGPASDRPYVVDVLSSLYPPPAAFLDGLTQLVARGDRHSCLAAIKAASRHGAEGLPVIRACLQSVDEEVRIRAYWGMERLMLRAPSLVPELAARMGDARGRERTAAAQALVSVVQFDEHPDARAFHALRDALDDDDTDLAALTTLALLHVDGQRDRALDSFADLVKREDVPRSVKERLLHYDFLVPLGRRTSEILPWLVAVLADGGPHHPPGDMWKLRVNHWAHHQITEAGSEAIAEAVKQLTESLNGFEPRNAACGLSLFGAASRPAVPDLIMLLGRGSHIAAILDQHADDMEKTVVENIMKFDPDYRPSPDLDMRQGIRDTDDMARAASAEALASIGDKSERVLAALRTALRDRSVDVRIAAAQALKSLDAETPASKAVIGADFKAAREHRIALAGTFLPEELESNPNVDELVKWLEHNEPPGVALQATRALAALGPKAAPGFGGLLKALDHGEDGQLRDAAAIALGRIGNREAIPHLVDGLDDPERNVRRECASALGAFGTDASAAVDPLMGELRDESDEARTEAAIALSRIVPGERRNVPVLLEKATSIEKYSHYRLMAACALLRMGTSYEPVFVDAILTEIRGAGLGLDEWWDDDAAQESVLDDLRAGTQGTARVVSALLEMATSDNILARSRGVWGLARLGVKARAARSDLETLLQGAKGDFAKRIRDALRALETGPPPADGAL